MSMLQRLGRVVPRRRRPPCPACGYGLARSFRFCPQCGTSVLAYLASLRDGTTVASSVRAVDVGLAPDGLGSTVTASGPSLQVVGMETERLVEERRLVTVLFADLSGSTALGERLDPEDLRRILASFFSALSRRIQRYGGTVDKFIGDAVMAVFGAPVAHEDDLVRAIRAALAMQSAIARLNDDLEREHGMRLALRIGINTGEVVAGLLAGEVQGAYTVVGDTVNMAQRLESAAPPGQILVGAVTYRLAQHVFDLRPLPPVTVKGKSEPVPVYQVICPLDVSEVAESGELLGRSRELATLRDALTSAMHAAGTVVALTGDAGVGKSRLVREFLLARAAGIDRIVARCASFDESTPYALIADYVRSAFQIPSGATEGAARDALVRGFAALDYQADEWHINLLLGVLGYPVQSTFDPESKRRILVNLVRVILERRSERAPLVLLLEDLHWLDSASAAVLDGLVPEASSLTCLVIATGRPDWTPPWPCQRIDLQPLGAEAARDLVIRSLGGEAEPAVMDAILAKTAGNPFFTQEVARSLRESGAIEEHDGVWSATGSMDLAVPATIHEVLAARLDRLPAGTRRTLQTAAVIGRTFWHRVVERVALSPTLAAELEALEAKAFIELRAAAPERTYAFRHALIQEVAYGTLLQAQRRIAHGTVGTAIEAVFDDRIDEFVDELAFHYGRSDEDAKALHWLVAAGDRAGGLYANTEALTLYQSALDRASHVDGPVTAGDLLERMADVHTLVGGYDDALERVRVARELAQAEPTRIARLERKRGTALTWKGVYGDALAALGDGLRALSGDEDVEAARIAVRIGEVEDRRGDYAAAEDAFRRAVDIAERLAADDVLAEALKYLGNVLTFRGDLPGAEAAYARCLPIYQRMENLDGMAATLNGMAMLHRRMARFDEALGEFHQALAIVERIGHRLAAGMCHNNIGTLHVQRGDFAEAITAKERALATFTAMGAEAGATLALITLGGARARAGDYDRAREELLDAERRSLAQGSQRHLTELYCSLALAELGAGDLDAAEQAAERAIEQARASKSRQGEAVAQRVLGQITLARGDRDRARALLEASRACLADLGQEDERQLTEAVLLALGAEPTTPAAAGHPH